MMREQNREALVAFLETIRRPDCTVEEIDDGSSLIEAGLIDSLAILEIMTFLESKFDVSFMDQGVDPQDFLSIAGILDLIDHHPV